jgi:hypothetical protein
MPTSSILFGLGHEDDGRRVPALHHLSVELDADAEENLEELLLNLVAQPLVHCLYLGRWNAGWDQSHVQLVHQTRPKTRFRLNKQSV